MVIVQEFLQEVPIEEAVRRLIGVPLSPRTYGGTVLGVGRLRDLRDDPAQVTLERGHVERELGRHVDDYADAAGGREEE